MNKWGGINDMPKGWAAEHKREYQLWIDMLRRCYDEDSLARDKGRAYKKCEVCDEWKILSNFVRDIKTLAGYEQWTSVNGMALDKDILCDGSKEYNKRNCCFVPSSVNLAVMNRQNPNITAKAIEMSKAKYAIEKDGVRHIFNTEKEACAFLGVKQCSVAGAWRDRGTCKGYKVTRLGNGADMRGERDENPRQDI